MTCFHYTPDMDFPAGLPIDERGISHFDQDEACVLLSSSTPFETFSKEMFRER